MYSNESFVIKEQQSKELIFTTLETLLIQSNWHKDLIRESEAKNFFPKYYSEFLFPGGIKSVVLEFDKWQSDKTLKILSKSDFPEKIRDKITLALNTRIIKVMDKQILLRQFAFFSVFYNFDIAMKAIIYNVDLLWRYADDKSTDFNFYTKRFLLALIYILASNFYQADNSENARDTEVFIKYLVDNIANLQKIKKHLTHSIIVKIPILRLFL
ncbi:COQ9 family protein [Rickettsia endosymbiont of Cardiosporidium cionae]|uniref:COQ9 family protein n=1 Tax=Rickettsia endosymbiont of Cardiosporidium cionae TaxID=2777155 RepID=UPI001892E773|nr:COQ9 family protein [Rickettsia endosymbiont of Cardiosporidium cionae]KAF8819004.1 COQ9 family protein [Rickettsia endosymbiont of Cardiosporidium cionae]